MSALLQRVSIGLVLLWALPGCSVETEAGAATGTIKGHVSLGPIMPVCRVGTPCDGVYAGAKVAVRTAGGTVVARSAADQRGEFQIDVSAGAYVVGVEVSGPLPHCSQTDVTVAAGQMSKADIDCDSGIR